THPLEITCVGVTLSACGPRPAGRPGMIHGLDTGFLVAAKVTEHGEHMGARATLARLLACTEIFGRLSMRAWTVRQRDASQRGYDNPTLGAGEPPLCPMLRTPSACTACSAPLPSASIAPSSIPTRWPNGSRRTALPPRSIRWTRGLAAATGCRSPTSAPAR